MKRNLSEGFIIPTTGFEDGLFAHSQQVCPAGACGRMDAGVCPNTSACGTLQKPPLASFFERSHGGEI